MSKEYVDLGELEQDTYECQRCKQIFQEKFERNECPNCDLGEGVYSDSCWAKEHTLVKHGVGRLYGVDRAVRL